MQRIYIIFNHCDFLAQENLCNELKSKRKGEKKNGKQILNSRKWVTMCVPYLFHWVFFFSFVRHSSVCANHLKLLNAIAWFGLAHFLIQIINYMPFTLIFKQDKWMTIMDFYFHLVFFKYVCVSGFFFVLCLFWIRYIFNYSATACAWSHFLLFRCFLYTSSSSTLFFFLISFVCFCCCNFCFIPSLFEISFFLFAVVVFPRLPFDCIQQRSTCHLNSELCWFFFYYFFTVLTLFFSFILPGLFGKR